MEFILKKSPYIEHIDLSQNTCNLKLAKVIQNIIIEKNILILKMSEMKITSKMLFILSLGIGRSETIKRIDFSKNLIGIFSFFFFFKFILL